jgi:hypothetical protein
MTRKTKLFLAVLLLPLIAVLGCRSRTDRSAGTVILSLASFTGLPVQVSVRNGPYQIGTLTLQTIAKDPTGTTSSLQDLEVQSYSVTYARHDGGTRLPPTISTGLFGFIPVNGTTTFNNIPFLGAAQLQNPPLSDLVNFGVDRETGSATITLDCTMQFFGQSLSGDKIASNLASFSIEVTQ